MISLEKPSLDSLSHFGVPGMRWGVINEDSVNVSRAKEKVTARKEEWKKAVKSNANPNKISSTAKEIKYAKEDLQGTKILEKLSSKQKSNSQLKMEAKYKAKGYSDDEAAVAAYKNIKTKKIIAVGATVVLTAAAGYAAYKYHDNTIDKIIKSGTLLQNISDDSTAGVRDAFYSSSGKMDGIKYKGLLGTQISQQFEVKGGNLVTKSAIQKQISTLSDLKQASPKNAHKMFEELVKNDPQFRKNLPNALKDAAQTMGNQTYLDKYTKGANALSKGVVSKDAYELFNASLVLHNPTQQPLTDKYFSTLASKGYNAIRDVNDSKYSGYKTLNPIIAFGTKNKVAVIEVKELVDSEVKKAKNVAIASLLLSEAKKSVAVSVAVAGATKATKAVIKTGVTNSQIDAYRAKHPDTKLTPLEITRMLERKTP